MRGNITRRGKGSWQLKFDVPAVDGKRQQRYATVRGTRQDAQKELTRLLAASDTGKPPGSVQRHRSGICGVLARQCA